MTIYRGYTLNTDSDGKVSVHSYGSFPIVEERFDNEEAAMNHIDKLRRPKLSIAKGE